MNMKTVLLIAGDYWHPTETVRPLAAEMFPEDAWKLIFTEDPKALLALEEAPDLIVSIKDTVENNQLPTPNWCDDAWMNRALTDVREHGTGLLLIHAALADLTIDHPLVTEVIEGLFTGHPAQCPLTFKPIKEHAILDGVTAFTFPDNDEHYMMDMLDGARVDMIAQTQSQHGAQPGLWVKEMGRGRVCCVTPGHTTKNLLYDAYLQVLKNAAAWCSRS